MRVKSDSRQNSMHAKRTLFEEWGGKRQPKEFNINIVHAQIHGMDPAALPSGTYLLPSRGPLSSSEKTRPPLRSSATTTTQQPCHWDPRITFTESRPSPSPPLTGSDRHRHHRAIAIAAKTNKTSGKNGPRMQRKKKDSARGGERMKNARDLECSVGSYWRTKVNLQLGWEGWKFTARVSTWTVVVLMVLAVYRVRR